VDEVNSVYVGGLPYEANEEMLRDAFGYYGTIVSVKVSPAPPSSTLRLVSSRVCSRESLPGAAGLIRWSEAVLRPVMFFEIYGGKAG
jgi:hypothetical protein